MCPTGSGWVRLWAGICALFVPALRPGVGVGVPERRKLRALELVPNEVLPTMAGALTAAALGQSPLDWRYAVGSGTTRRE